MAPSSTILADPEAMFFHAASIDYASTVLDIQKILSMQLAISSKMKSWSVPTLIPAIITSAFSIEIYFKCIIRIETGQNPPRFQGKNGHDLVRYFQLISNQMQLDIRSQHLKLTNTDPVLLGHAKAHQQATGQPFIWDFDKELESARHAFYRWRYFYDEPATFGGSNPQIIRVACREAIISKYANCRVIWDRFPPLFPTFSTYPIH